MKEPSESRSVEEFANATDEVLAPMNEDNRDITRG